MELVANCSESTEDANFDDDTAALLAGNSARRGAAAPANGSISRIAGGEGGIPLPSGRNFLAAVGLIALAFVAGARHSTLRVNASTSKLYGNQVDERDVHSRLWSSSPKPSEYCMSADGDVRDLIQTADQIILVMPPKAAGTTLKGFAQSCNDNSYKKLMQNFLNHRAYLEKLLTHSYEMPGVLASHVYKAEGLLGTLGNLPRNSLLIYSHREETSRVTSAIAHVAKKVCHERGFDGACNIKEEELIDLIKSGRDEIKNSRVLTCDVYEAIEGYAPNMIFVEYRNAQRLMTLLAEKLCPDADEQWQNAGDKSDPIRVQGDGFNVTVKDWLRSKASTLELSLNLNNDTHATSCRGRTRTMEDRLFSCPDGFLNAKGIGTLA